MNKETKKAVAALRKANEYVAEEFAPFSVETYYQYAVIEKSFLNLERRIGALIEGLELSDDEK